MLDYEVKRRPIRQPKDRLPGFQRLDFRQQHILFKVDLLEPLFQGELRAAEGFQFPLLPRIA